MANLRSAVTIAAFPLAVLALLLAFIGVYQLLGLPASDELVEVANSYMARYGYVVVLIGALLEGTPVVNFYLPGSTVVVLAVAFSRHGALNVFAVLAVATLAFLVSYIFDYAAGRYGWYVLMLRFGLGPALDRTRGRVVQHGTKWLWVAYVHPNVGALAATACGILKVPFGRFVLLSIPALACWDALWGAITYFGADQLLRFLDMRWLIPAIAVWVLYAIIKGIRTRSDE